MVGKDAKQEKRKDMKYEGGCSNLKNVFGICEENFCPRCKCMMPKSCTYHRKKVKSYSFDSIKKEVPKDV